MRSQWKGFKTGSWATKIDVRDFIQSNYIPYEGDAGFLEGPTERTKKVFDEFQTLHKEELKKGVLDVDTKRVSGIDHFKAGYIDKENEVIVGFQTDKPLKRMINPYGGIRMVQSSLEAFGHPMDRSLEEIFTEYRKTHNQGVFDAYTEEIKTARSVGLITGLPDAYGRGRIIGDYRRIALYGLDILIQNKRDDLKHLNVTFDEENIRAREEIAEQIRALDKIRRMAKEYGYDLSHPASNAKEAVQWVYFGYLAGVKESNGAAMSLGRASTFIDIYIERDLKEGIITEKEAQEIIDQFVVKLRMIRHLRTPEYNELFAGDPNWVTPLWSERKQLCGFGNHPFYQDAESQAFLVRQGDRVVGRVVDGHAAGRSLGLVVRLPLRELLAIVPSRRQRGGVGRALHLLFA
ncbi:MAG: hypothetical protein MJA31_10135, partial [Clostridia bacterium]|nr:hypothetical protein [Clostridia bacterium]